MKEEREEKRKMEWGKNGVEATDEGGERAGHSRGERKKGTDRRKGKKRGE